MEKATQNYIYYKEKNWKSAKSKLKSALNIENGDILSAYKESAKKLESGLNLGQLPPTFIEDVQKALDFNNLEIPKLNGQLNNQFFLDIANFVGEELSQSFLTPRTGLTVGNANVKLKKMLLSAQELNDIIINLQKIVDKIDNFDSSFKTLDANEVSFLDYSSMTKTKTAYEAVKNFISKYGTIENGQGLEEIKKELIRVLGLVNGDLKGGLFEFADYAHSVAIATAHEEISKAVKITGGKLSGTGNIDITSDKLKQQLGQGSFVSKADNIVTVVTYGPNNVEIELQLGISNKSYKSGKARGKSLASGISWPALMYEAGLTESAFEYYYANLIVFNETGDLSKKSIYNRYLAAKAASFIISGFSGGATGSQAYFIRYANKLVYVPDLLRKIGDTGKTLFQLIPTAKSIENKFVQTSADEMTDAYARVRNTMSALRSTVKFNAYR